MKVIGVISARLSKTARVPDKVLLPLAGRSSLEHHIDRMKAADGIDGVFVATSRYPGNEILAEIAEKNNVGWIAGSENDVIDRHIALCEREGADACIRITCDSPLFEWRVIKPMVDKFNEGYDYVYVPNIPIECSITPELIALDALKRSHEYYQGEAVTLPIWEHYDKFKCFGLNMPENITRPEYILTIDTPQDYVTMSHIYRVLYNRECIFLEDVYKWLDKNPYMVAFNSKHENSAINKRFIEAMKNANNT